MSDNKAQRRLINSTIVYMIGSLSSKVLQLLILPILTTFLKTSEYGFYDLVISSINLVLPIITLQILDAMFRFIIDGQESDEELIISTVFIYLIAGSFFLSIIVFFFDVVYDIQYNLILILLCYVLAIFFEFTQKTARCKQLNKEFAISGVIYTMSNLILQWSALAILNLKVEGMLIANILSYTLSSAYLFCKLNMRELISFCKFSTSKFKQLIQYSLPLVANSVAWWIVSSSDRYIISFFLGADANGIYSIAAKFSQILTFFVTVFQLSWQESAIIEQNSKKKDEFYSSTFKGYFSFLLSGYIIALPFIKLIVPFLLMQDYQKGYIYTPLLLLGAVFCAFSQFYGTFYLALKKTSGVFYTTVVAMIVDLLIVFLLIEKIGLFAPALGVMTSFLIQWLLRVYQLRSYLVIKMDYKKCIYLIGCSLFSVVMYYMDGVRYQFISLVVSVFVAVFVNKRLIEQIASKIKTKLMLKV